MRLPGLSCKELSRRVASDTLDEVGRPARWMIWLHLVLCVHCRRYKEQMDAIRKVTKKLWPESADPRNLQGLRERILQNRDSS